jgi:hypothetical protein
MEPSTASQTPASVSPHTDAVETGAAEHTSDTRPLGHTKLPSLGSGPIFPFSWLIGLFRRKDTPTA